KGAGLLLASTSEIYGDPLVHPQHEEYWGNVNSIGPRGCYDEAKRFAEAIMMAYHRMHQIDTKIARIFNTYGPRMRLNDGRIVPNFIKQAVLGEPLTVYGDGSQTRSFCYVSDLVDGLYRLALSSENLPINIGNPHEFTVLEFANLVKEITNSPSPIEFRPLPQDDPKQRRPDITKARTRLGWEPTVQFREGLLTTLEYFRSKLGSAN
ncbi:MAG TPA: GDP-mannose 4,6-dehydratase, partial [Abditibacteriaceae bacterium]|nr:GDP-mannose 4,6-dehydratase [Abditibacteriaceae bacterium]